MSMIRRQGTGVRRAAGRGP